MSGYSVKVWEFRGGIKLNRSESIIKLGSALVKFNSEVSSISKDAKNPFFKSEYVTLDKLIIATRDILQKNGLSVLQFPLSRDKEIGIQTILLHESGEYIETEPLYMMPIKNDPQAAGSLITYLRRYSYQSVLNLNTGEDDDANQCTHQEPVKESKKDKIISEAQTKRLYAIGKGKDAAVIKEILSGFGYNTSKDIQVKDYEKICKKIEEL